MSILFVSVKVMVQISHTLVLLLVGSLQHVSPPQQEYVVFAGGEGPVKLPDDVVALAGGDG